MFTVKDMLEIPDFRDFRIIAGEGGSSREIKTVSVMDAPDIYEWMKGGEFLITSAYVMREHPEQAADLIERLVENGASAFGIKFTRFIDGLPKEALETAEKLNFPIISIPVEFAFTDVIDPVLREIVDAQIEAKYREEFVQDLIYSNIKYREEVYNRAEIYHWDFRNGGMVVIVDVDDFKLKYAEGLDRQKNERMEWDMSRVMRISGNILRQSGHQISFSKLNDRIVYIVSFVQGMEEISRLRELLERLREEIHRQTELTVTIGVGKYCGDIFDISESFQEAKKAIVISRTLYPRDRVSCYEELGIYKLLNLVKNTPEAEEFEEKYVTKLKEYDRKNKSELWDTLAVLVQCGWNMRKASEQLYIHYNSMKYRYRKICEVLGEDLQNYDRRLDAQIAVDLHLLGKGDGE